MIAPTASTKPTDRIQLPGGTISTNNDAAAIDASETTILRLSILMGATVVVQEFGARIIQPSGVLAGSRSIFIFMQNRAATEPPRYVFVTVRRRNAADGSILPGGHVAAHESAAG